MHCADCERIDDILFDETRFWFYFDAQEAFTRIAILCGKQGLTARQFNSRGISVCVARAKIDSFLTAIFGELNLKELGGMRVLTTDGGEPKVEDMGRVMTGDTFINRFKGQWVVDAIQAERFETWFQPIYHASRNADAKVFGAEGLFRLRDPAGQIIPPGYVFKLAGDAELLFSIDLTARASAVKTAAESGFRGKIFVNFNPSSIYDPSYCLRTTAATIDELGLQPSDIVFELTETHQAQDKDHLKGILAFYRQAGFAVALDDIGSGWSGLNMMHEFRPDYVKMDMDLVRDIDTDTFKQSIVHHLVSIAKAHNIKIIAEGIETEAEANFLCDQNVDLMQGFLFARPAPMPKVMESLKAA